MVLSPSCKISYVGAEFNTLKLALSIDVERAGEGYGMLFVLLTVHSNQSWLTGFLQNMGNTSRGSLHVYSCG